MSALWRGMKQGEVMSVTRGNGPSLFEVVTISEGEYEWKINTICQFNRDR